MAFEWDEAGARKRLADYTAALHGVVADLQAGEEPREFGISETRERLEHWCWHDGKHAFAEIDRLRAALERLGSSEAFGVPFVLADGSVSVELRARIEFARQALKK